MIVLLILLSGLAWLAWVYAELSYLQRQLADMNPQRSLPEAKALPPRGDP